MNEKHIGIVGSLFAAAWIGAGIGIYNYGHSARADAVELAATVSPYTGVTGNIGGSLLLLAGCSTGTATVPGAKVGMVSIATPNTPPGGGAQWQSYISANDTVTVSVCALAAVTPPTSQYNVRVFP